MFNFFKPKVKIDTWCNESIKQLTNEESENLRKKFYRIVKEQIPKLVASEEKFSNIIMGGQLEMLSFVSTKCNEKLGESMSRWILINYFDKLQEPKRTLVHNSCKYCNWKLPEYGVRGIAGYKAISDGCAEQLDLAKYPHIVKMLCEEFLILQEKIRVATKQHKFVGKVLTEKNKAMNHAKLAYKACFRKDFLGGIKYAKEAIDMHPVGTGYWLMGNAYEMLADKTGNEGYRPLAVLYWTIAKKIHPPISMPLARINNNSLSEDYTEAIATTGLEHEYVDAYYYRGIAKRALQDHDGATDDFKKARELGKNSESEEPHTIDP